MTQRFDVLVVGLGAMGAATLYQLSRLGIRAAGLDRYAPPHTLGSTHGETRLTRLSIGEGDAYVPFAARSHEIWREVEQEVGEDLLTQCGYVMIAPPGTTTLHHGHSDFLGHTIEVARRHAIRHEVLDAAAVHARFPALTPRPGEMAYWEPEGGFVRPEACVAAQLRLAAANGATILTDTPALAIHHRADGVVVETPTGTVEAAQLVVAAGAWAGKLLGAPYDRLLVPFRQVLHWFPSTNPAIHQPGPMPVYIWVHESLPGQFFYGFPALPGRPPHMAEVKLGIEQDHQSCDPDTVDRTIAADDGPAVYANHIHNRVAGLGPVPNRSATCLYTITGDSGFVIERVPGRDRITVVSPCSGHGFKHSAALGEAVAQWVTSGRSTISLTSFASSRLTAQAA